MENEKDVDKTFVEAFNKGYLIGMHEPLLAAQLLTATKNDEKGLRHGLEQAAKEREHDLLPEWLREDRFSSLHHENDAIKDKTDFEKDDR